MSDSYNSFIKTLLKKATPVQLLRVRDIIGSGARNDEFSKHYLKAHEAFDRGDYGNNSLCQMLSRGPLEYALR